MQKKEKKKEKKKETIKKKQLLYQNKQFQITILIIYLAIVLISTVIIGIFDEQISSKLVLINETNDFIANFSKFCDRSMFDGDGFGGQDLSYLLILLSLFLYIISYIRFLPEKFYLKMKPTRKYTGFFISSALALTILNRGLKAFIARVRPYDVANSPNLYSPMWKFGNYSFSTALSKGSFTSGHTNVVVMLVVFAFILIRTHKPTIISLGFSVTIILTILMAFSRVFVGNHYLTDGFWSIYLGIPIITWIYFFVLKIPEQESGEKKEFAKFEEFRWGFLFVILWILIFAALISLRYIFIEFQWYQIPIILLSPSVGYFINKRMKKITL